MKKTLGLAAMAVLGLFVFAACGGSDSGASGSCTTNEGTTNQACAEYDFSVSAGTADIEKSCTENNGKWSSGDCSRANAVGGCNTSNAYATYTTWFYKIGADSTVTVESVKMICTSSNSTFIAP